MIEFVSVTGDGRVHHKAFINGRLLWAGGDLMSLLGTDQFAAWPSGEAEGLARYLGNHSDIYVKMEWYLSKENGVSGIALVEDERIDFYGTIFSLFEAAPLEQVLRF
ncbi:hypothetical protein [Ensifer sp. Root558]|uniref:hypothetical protein n=1 Tax=Ensifer sp. Root558 TaxID=1736558 RepID=UPI000715D443|nr:hypothetical protein [Ensifer sp. Root558]KQZ44676.1 hypothetical protein ASD63_33070 [Ensifer sp. Root558]